MSTQQSPERLTPPSYNPRERFDQISIDIPLKQNDEH